MCLQISSQMHIFQDEAEAANDAVLYFLMVLTLVWYFMYVTWKISTEVTLWKFHVNSDLLIHLQLSLQIKTKQTWSWAKTDSRKMHFGALPAPYPIRPPLLRWHYIGIILMGKVLSLAILKFLPPTFFNLKTPWEPGRHLQCQGCFCFCYCTQISEDFGHLWKYSDLFGNISICLCCKHSHDKKSHAFNSQKVGRYTIIISSR